MPTSLIVVDDLLTDPESFRRTALELTYPEQQGAFPGRNSLQRVTIPGLDEEVSRLTGEALKPVEPLRSHAKCRITLAGDQGRGRVHTDSSLWSGILYLSRPEDCRGGTQFFRHIRTNSDSAPVTKGQLAAMGYASQDEANDDIIVRDSVNEAAWQLTMEVPMRFNRLLLLRPWLWHTAGPAFGDRLENGRLVYLLFYRSARV